MPKKRFSDEQIAFALRQAESGTTIGEICRKMGIAEATFYRWKKVNAGMGVSEIRRLKQLEDGNSKLKRLVADLTLDREMLQDVIRRKPLRPARKRTLVDEMRSDWSVSIRRACAVIRFDPTTYRYRSRRPGQAALEQRIREICQTRVRCGYRRVHVLLRREGWMINQKKTRRIYNELGLQLRNKHPKRRVKAKLREDRQEAVGPNDVWAMDFVHDQLATGRTIRVLTVIDTFSRYVPALDPRFSYRGEDVVRTLETVCTRIGYPKTIRVDQGSEFISRDLDLWAYQKGVTLDFSRPGKPTDNAFIEAFNGRFRAECLNAHWFLSLADAAEKLEDWRKDYNEHRPHGAIGNKVPMDLMKSERAASPCS
ncbi:IS3 family transposase [Roseibium sp.]|uniref:IS3 family transposase n=1 Tax=Roseibium sp. TaxID=1936156 RepID=UPI0039191815